MTRRQIVDLEDLALTCVHPQSEELIREAIAAYHAGAFRAAVVTTWITVYFDIVEAAGHPCGQHIPLMDRVGNHPQMSRRDLEYAEAIWLKGGNIAHQSGWTRHLRELNSVQVVDT